MLPHRLDDTADGQFVRIDNPLAWEQPHWQGYCIEPVSSSPIEDFPGAVFFRIDNPQVWEQPHGEWFCFASFSCVARPGGRAQDDTYYPPGHRLSRSWVDNPAGGGILSVAAPGCESSFEDNVPSHPCYCEVPDSTGSPTRRMPSQAGVDNPAGGAYRRSRPSSHSQGGGDADNTSNGAVLSGLAKTPL